MNRANINIPKLNTPNISNEENIKYEAMLSKLSEFIAVHCRIFSILMEYIPTEKTQEKLKDY